MFESVTSRCFQLCVFGGLLADGTRVWRWQVFMALSFLPEAKVSRSTKQRNRTGCFDQFAAENRTAKVKKWVAVHRGVALGGQPEVASCSEIGFYCAEIFG